MNELALPTPELVDVVPVEQADALIAASRQILVDLRYEVDTATIAAEAAERHAIAVGADPTLVGRAAEQVQRFIEEQRGSTDVELKGLLDSATEQARDRVDQARREADRILADARRLADGTPDPRPSALPSLDADHTWHPSVVPALGAAARLAAAPPAAYEPAAPPAPDLAGAAAPAARGTAQLPAVPPTHEQAAPGPPEPMYLPATHSIRPEAAPASPPSWAPAPPSATIPVPPPAAAPSWPAAEASPSTPSDPAVPQEDAAANSPARLRLGSVPLFAVLQVCALLVVLVVLLAFVN